MTAEWTRLRKARERTGRRAETAAALWLQLKGYHIRDRRVRTKVGEIDLVASKGRMLVFIEVKARTTMQAALEAVTPEAQQRIEHAARLWTARKRLLDDWLWRFDIVLLVPGRLPRHMCDAWRAEHP